MAGLRQSDVTACPRTSLLTGWPVLKLAIPKGLLLTQCFARSFLGILEFLPAGHEVNKSHSQVRPVPRASKMRVLGKCKWQIFRHSKRNAAQAIAAFSANPSALSLGSRAWILTNNSHSKAGRVPQWLARKRLFGLCRETIINRLERGSPILDWYFSSQPNMSRQNYCGDSAIGIAIYRRELLDHCGRVLRIQDKESRFVPSKSPAFLLH